MVLQARAWRLRRTARNAIVAGDPALALHFASAAEAICRTPEGRRLKWLGWWLSSQSSSNGSATE